MVKKCKLSSRQACWILRIQDFNITVIQYPGKANAVSDLLSRYPRYLDQVTVFQVSEELCAAVPCKVSEGTDDLVHWVQCDTCDGWFHTQCIGLLNEEYVEEEFICNACKELKTQKVKPVISNVLSDKEFALEQGKDPFTSRILQLLQEPNLNNERNTLKSHVKF